MQNVGGHVKDRTCYQASTIDNKEENWCILVVLCD